MKIQAFTAAITTVLAERVGLEIRTIVSQQYDEKSYAEAWITRMTEAAERTTPDHCKIVGKVSMSIIDTDDFEVYTPNYSVTVNRTITMSKVISVPADNETEAEKIVQDNIDNDRYDWEYEMDGESTDDIIEYTEEQL